MVTQRVIQVSEVTVSILSEQNEKLRIVSECHKPALRYYVSVTGHVEGIV